MRRSLSLFIALRYLLSNRRQGYLSLISWFSLLGMTVGVAALVVVSSVMNGFELQLQQRILNVVPHVFIHSDKQQDAQLQSVLSEHPKIIASVPFRKREGMAGFNGRLHGVVINGVKAQSFGQVSSVPSAMLIGEVELLKPKEYRVIIGRGLARQLGSYVGDKITLILPTLTRTPAGVFPRTRRFIVSGIFEVGAEVDVNQVFIDLSDFERLMRDEKNTVAYRVKVNDVLQAAPVASQLRQKLPAGITVEDWSLTHGGLFQAVKVEKLMVAVLLAIIVAVAAFNIVAVLTMMVINKRAAIAVLQTMGASRTMIIRVFMLQGFMLGAVGVVLGVAIGLPIALYIGDIMGFFEQLLGATLFDSNVFYIVHLPSDVQPLHVIYVVITGLLCSGLATLYPAIRASAVQPSEVLRYE